MNAGSLYEVLELPEHDRATAVSRNEGEFIFTLLKERGLSRTVEIGFAYGVSAAYIISATRAPHYAIDPQPEAYGGLGLENLRKLGLEAFCHLERDVAHLALPRLVAAGRLVDFAFVDGDHKFDTTFVEFYYLDLMLEPHGCVVFHDAWMPSIQYVADWIRTNKTAYRFVDTPLQNLIVVEKVGADTRDWTHFVEFSGRLPLARRLKRYLPRRASSMPAASTT